MATEPSPASPSPSPAAVELRRGVTSLARRLRTERSPERLSLGKLSVLSHLWHYGPSTPGAVAEAERLQPQSLTRVFAELEQAGLVTRRRSPDDGRQWVLELSS